MKSCASASFAAEHAEVREEIEGVEPREHRVASTHGKTGQRAALRIAPHGVFLLDERNDGLPHFLLENFEGQIRVLRMIAVNHLVVRQRDDHRYRFPLGQQVVHDEVHAAVVDPVRRQFAAASREIKHGVGPGPVVPGRRVHVEFAFPFGDFRVVNMPRDIPVRYAARIIIRRAVTVDNQFAVRRHGRERRVGVVRIGHRDAVDVDVVRVHVRAQRANGERPNTVFPFREGHHLSRFAQRRENRHAGEAHLLRFGRPHAENHGAVVAHVGRIQRSAERHEVLRVLLWVEVEVDVGLLR